MQVVSFNSMIKLDFTQYFNVELQLHRYCYQTENY